MSLQFNEVTHTYYWNGSPIPSVTQVIEQGLGDRFKHVDPQVLELAGQFGHATHKAINLDIWGMLDYSTVDDALIPYINAYKAFACDYGLTVMCTEERLYSDFYRFAGTIDVIGNVRGISAIIDWKTGILNKLACGLQLGGYDLLIPRTDTTQYIDPLKLAVQLRDDSTYRVMDVSDPMYRYQFIKLLQQFDMEEFTNERKQREILESA